MEKVMYETNENILQDTNKAASLVKQPQSITQIKHYLLNVPMLLWTWGKQNICIFIKFYLVCASPYLQGYHPYPHLLFGFPQIILWLFIGMKLKILLKHFRDYTSLQMCSLCFFHGSINCFKRMACWYC